MIAGDADGSFGAGLQSHAAALGVADSIDFVGFVTGKAKAQHLANADVFVLPSRHENFGVAIVEALFAGIPVVVGPEVALAGLIQQNGLGILAPLTADGIATALSRALADADLRERCREAGPHVIRATFAPAVIAQQLDRMYGAAVAASDSR